MSRKSLRGLVAAATIAVSSLVAPTAFAATPTTISSGDAIYMKRTDGKTPRCTLNHVVKDTDGTLYGVTAGHCLVTKNGVKVTSVKDAKGTVISSTPLESTALLKGNASIKNPKGDLTDISMFRLADNVTYSGQLSGGAINLPIPATALSSQLANATIHNLVPPRPVTGIIPVSAVRPGEVVCKDGSSTGRTCGLILSTNPKTGTIFAAIPAMAGDSGSPLYVLRPGGRKIVGTLSQGTPLLFNVFDDAGVH